MKNISSIGFSKIPRCILALILAVFFLKGVFLVSAFPIFAGQDESRHYNSIQYLSEPKIKNWTIIPFKQLSKQEKDNIETYRYSDEIKQTSLATNTDILRGEEFNTIIFSNAYSGANENQINAHQWDPYNKNQYPDVVSGSIYHKIGSLFEKIFSNQSILFRFYTIRILSVFLGLSVIILAYLTAINVGFSTKNSLILTAIISFQPKLTTYFTNINYDVLLIPLFALFTYAGILILKKGISWKRLSLLFFSIIIAISTKKTGAILLVPAAALIISAFWPRFKKATRNIQYGFYIITSILGLSILFFLSKNITSNVTLSSIGDYLDKSLSIGRFALSSRTYWGSLSWVDNPVLDQITNIIWFMQTLAVAGFGIFFFSNFPKPSYLPEKKYIIFLIGIVISLQLGIRTADWIVFSQTGSLDLGTPGRYFLPNIVAHIILVFTGLGMFFEWLKTSKFIKALDSRLRGNDIGEKLFDFSLKISLILMMSLTMYIIFNEIVFRYYL